VIIIQALRAARSAYVVYFLLSAWLEALEHNGRARHLPLDVTRWPVRDGNDVYDRMRSVRQRLASGADTRPESVRALQDAAAALAVACDKLRELTESRPVRVDRSLPIPRHPIAVERRRWQERTPANPNVEL